jgi:tetratricopeptide (TPR) repeat protein
MLQTNRKVLVLTLGLALSGSLLVGCSGKEERQAKYLQRAQEYLNKGDYDKARVEAKNVLQINTNNGEARYIFAEIAEHENNWQQMFSELRAAIESDPKLLKAHVKMAQLLIMANQIDQAKDEVAKIHNLDPNNADYFSMSAAIAARQNKTDEAIEDAQKSLSISPSNMHAAAILVSIYAESDPAKAEKIIAEAIRLNPDEEDLQMIQVRLFAKQNKIDQAIDAMKKVIKRYPEKPIYISQLANYYISQNRAGEAETMLQQIVKEQPENTDIKLALVEFTAKQHKPEDALALLTQYSGAEPNNYKLRSTLARFYVATNAPDKAIATYQYTIDKDVHGEGIDARNRVVEILLAQKKVPEAKALLQDILKLEPENGDALLTRARLEIVDNNPDSAIADLRAVLKGTPDSPQALSLLAIAQERTGSYNLALDTYKKILEKNANDVGALLGAARLDIGENQLDEAQKLLEQARKVAGTNVDVARLLVDLYVRKQQWQPALELCDQLTLNSNSAAVGYYLKGLVQLQKKDTSEGIDSLKKALEKEPRAIEPLQALISTYINTKQADKATTYLESHLKTYPDQIHAQELLGVVYRQTGKLSQAQQLLEGIIKNQPSRISAYRELMVTYIAEKQPAQIEPLLDKGLQQNPNNVDLLALQAQFFQKTGKDQQAIDSYNKALQLQPKSDVLRNNLAVLLMDKFPSDDNLRRAQSLTADFADSKNPLFVDTLAWLQYRMKNYQQSISLLESVLKKDIDVPELRYHLGMAYLKNGDPAKAKTELSKATETKAQYSGREEAEAELKKL